MIRYSEGDIFEAGCEAIANPVNCVGVMGAGLAKAVHKRYPAACGSYFEACREGVLRPGGLTIGVVGANDWRTYPHWIFHVATKLHWRQPSHLADIAHGLDRLAETAGTMRLASVAVPALGCGLGGLDWGSVHSLMLGYLGETKAVEWVVFPPKGL